MELLNPEQHVGDQEAADLSAAEVELVRAPVGMDLALVEHVAVEGREPLGVGAEAAGDPVEDHADARLVARVDEVHELLGLAVAGGHRVVARSLVSPRAVEGMLHDGQHLDVGVAHLAHVVDELDRQVVIGVVLAALRGERIHGAGVVAVLVRLALRLVAVAAPAAQMDLVDVQGFLHVVGGVAGVHPGLVAPLVALDVHQARCGARDLLAPEPVGVGLVEELAVVRLDDVLIEVALGEPGHEPLPQTARGKLVELVRLDVPVVEVADDGDACDFGRPDAEAPSVHAVLRVGMRAHLFPAAVP